MYSLRYKKFIFVQKLCIYIIEQKIDRDINGKQRKNLSKYYNNN